MGKPRLTARVMRGLVVALSDPLWVHLFIRPNPGAPRPYDPDVKKDVEAAVQYGRDLEQYLEDRA